MYDPNKKLWYAVDNTETELIKKFKNLQNADKTIDDSKKIQNKQSNHESNRIYLNVPYKNKDDAKSLGAWWDNEKKLWYAPDKTYSDLVKKFEKVSSKAVTGKKIYLHVPFKEKEEAKALGARWDGQEKMWYAPNESHSKLINRFENLE